MTSPANPREWAFFQETTAGSGPADWAASGTRVRVIEGTPDPATIKPTSIDDPRAQEDIFTENDQVIGLENHEYGVSIPLCGAEVATDVATQVAATSYATILEHCLGGMWRGTRTFCKVGGTHTATQVELNSSTGYDEGTFLAVEDADDTGRLFIRRVTAVSGDQMTLDEALPFTPADNDVIWPCIDLYVDESVLKDSLVGPKQFSTLSQTGGAASGEYFESNGCKIELTRIVPVRNQLLACELTVKAASLKDPTEVSEPSWSGDPDGLAGVPVGPDGKAFFQDYGTTTASLVHVADLNIDVGVPVVRHETNTEVTAGMQGTRGYGTQPARTMLNFTQSPWSSDGITDYKAGTKKVFRWQKVGAAGQCVALHFSRVEWLEEQSRGEKNAISTNVHQLKAHKDTTNAAASSSEQWRSKIHIVLA